MTPVNDILDLFETISLKETEGLNLMDRVDRKFIFKLELLPSILDQLKQSYNCLKVNSKKINNYQNLYYDTTELLLYKQHHSRNLNRYKVRNRIYVDSGESYIEIKFKNNKGRTIKKRIESPRENAQFDINTNKFLSENLLFDPLTLKPQVWVNYNRITLINKQLSERLTLDLDLEFKKNGDQYRLEGLVIAEIKQKKLTNSPFLNIMKELKIRQEAISKYCLAISFTNNTVKKNNFKEKLLALKRIITNDPDTNIYRSIARP